jgi:flavin reductase (DIM6/NTAB) family NADH-FMN oxidoreductase RutF
MERALRPLVRGMQRDPHNESLVILGGNAMDERHLRNALGRFVTGVTVITTRTASGKLEGLTCNSFSAVSLDPPLVLWSLRLSSSCIDSFEDANHFAVNVLAAGQSDLSQQFATRSPDRFREVVHSPGLGGCPLLSGVLATFECTKDARIVSGDHVVFFGRIERAAYRQGEPLIFSAGKYATHSPLE